MSIDFRASLFNELKAISELYFREVKTKTAIETEIIVTNERIRLLRELINLENNSETKLP